MSEKHEMTAREFMRLMRRLSKKCTDKFTASCAKCKYRAACIFETEDAAIKALRQFETDYPEETLEPLGDNIYFDPKHRIVVDEMMRVYTIELTVVSANCPAELTADDLKEFGNDAATAILRDEYFDYVVDARCVRAQQFVTKCHEEEVFRRRGYPSDITSLESDGLPKIFNGEE